MIRAKYLWMVPFQSNRAKAYSEVIRQQTTFLCYMLKKCCLKKSKESFLPCSGPSTKPTSTSLFFIKLNQPESQLLLDAWKFQLFTHSSINPQYRTLSLSFADMNQNHSNKSRVMRLYWIIHLLEETINNTRRVSGSSCGHFFKTWSLTCLYYENFANPSQRAEF